MGYVNRLVVDKGKTQMGVFPRPEESVGQNSNIRYNIINIGGSRALIRQEKREIGAINVHHDDRDHRTGIPFYHNHMPKIYFPKDNRINPKGWLKKCR